MPFTLLLGSGFQFPWQFRFTTSLHEDFTAQRACLIIVHSTHLLLASNFFQEILADISAKEVLNT